MNVLSLFDGASCCMVCLKRAGIPIENYYGADIKKCAIRCEELIAEYYGVNHIQLGDVTKIDYLQLPKIDLLCAGFPCFQADTMIFTDKGYIPIQDIKVGDLVLTHKGNYKPVLAVGKRVANNCRVLKAECMLPILTTGNHPFLTDNGFVECDKLNKGDTVIAAKTNFIGEDMSLVDAYLLGRYVADGYIIDSLRKGRKNSYNHKVIFCVGKGKEDAFERFGFLKHFTKSKNKNVTKYILTDEQFMERCKKCGRGALNKQIPQIIFSCPDEIKKMFLQGYIEGDGNKYKDGFTATTISKKLALGLQLLLSSIGYKNHIYLSKRPRKHIIKGRVVNQHDVYQVRFYPHHPYKQEKIIQKKLQIEDNYVYNMEVADDHTYIADNYVVHNCQDYSVVNSRKQGIDGKNGQLFWEVVRAIKAVKPKYIILENVTTIPDETLKMIQRETGCFENRIVDPVELGWATRRKRIFFTNWLDWTDQPVPRKTRETLAELLDDDAKIVMHQRIGDLPHPVDNIPCQTQQQARLDKIGDTNSGSEKVITCIKRLDRHGLHDVEEIPCQQQGQALCPSGQRNKECVVIGVVNRSRDTLVYSDKEIATLVQNQPTRAGEGVFVLTNDPSKTPYKRKKIESMFDAGYTAFRCPTQAELARFHTYPVEVLQNFTPAHAQSLMGDGWHCGSIQWLFDKLKMKMENE